MVCRKVRTELFRRRVNKLALLSAFKSLTGSSKKMVNSTKRVSCLVVLLLGLVCCQKKASVETIMSEAHTLDSLGRYNEAVALYDSVIAIDSGNIDAYLNRRIDKGQLGDKESEILDLQKIIALDPDNTLAYFNLGVTYGNLNRIEESLENFNAAIRSKGGENVWLEMKSNDLVETGYKYDCPMEVIRLERGIVYYKLDSLKGAYYDFTFCIEKKYKLGESYYTGV